MRIITPDELKAERIAVLGQDLGEVYHALVNEISWILLKWDQYRSLFGTSPERVELLNKAAPLFFGIVEDVLWGDILLHLCRLTDSSNTTLSVKRLPKLLTKPDFRNEVTTLVDAAVASCKFARDWRNRRLAHSDLSLSIAAPSVPLAHASRAAVTEALETLTSLLKRIHLHYFTRDIDFNLAGEPGDAEALLRVLIEGVEATRARWQRFEEGNLLPDDWLGPRAL